MVLTTSQRQFVSEPRPVLPDSGRESTNRYRQWLCGVAVMTSAWGCARPTEQVVPDGPEATAVVSSCVVPPLPDVNGLKIVADVTYLDINGQSVQLDAAWREDLQGKGRGILLIVHGGAWREGSRRDYAVEMLQAAKLGYLTAAVDYRLTPTVKFPAPIQDVRCAVRFMKALGGELAFDSSRVMLLGVSAGSEISLLAAAEPSGTASLCPQLGASERVTAVASLSGAYDLRQTARPSNELQQAITVYLGGSPAALPLLAASASPVTVLPPLATPTLLVHGASDTSIPLTQAVAYRNALSRNGNRGTLVQVPQANHYFTPFDATSQFRESTCTLLSFLNQELGAR